MTNYYELLEVANTASTEVIRAAYKAGVKRYHPDNYTDAKDKARATERLKLLNEALNTLTDENLRAEYDAELAEELNFFGTRKNQNAQQTGYYNNNHGGANSEYRSRSTTQDGTQNAWNTHENENFQYDSNNESRRNSAYSGEYTSEHHGTSDLTAHVESMIVRCKNEAEYLDLHDQIAKSNVPEMEKRTTLSILDEFTKIRLQQELIDESKLEEYRKEAKSIKWAMIFWIVVGLGLSSKFGWAFWVGLALCIASYYGGKDDRENLARAELAAQRIGIYRMRGFKI